MQPEIPLEKPPSNNEMNIMHSMNIGWAISIIDALSECELPTNLSTIKTYTERQWHRLVSEKIEKMNLKRLIEDCHKMENGCKTPKTKTAHIVPIITQGTYTREPRNDITRLTKYESKMLIIARFGMLDCGKNLKRSMPETCN